MLFMEGATGLEALGTIFTQFMTWVGSLVTTISSTPLLLLPVGIFCVGAVKSKEIAHIKLGCIGET